MSSSKKLTCKGDFAAGVYLSEAQNAVPLPPLHAVCVYTSIQYLFTQGRGSGGGGEPERREGQHRSQSTEYRFQNWVENANMTM